MIGIDLVLKDLFVTSEGERIGNPRHTAKYAARLALAQRRLSKKKLGFEEPRQGPAESGSYSRKNLRLPHGPLAQAVPQTD